MRTASCTGSVVPAYGEPATFRSVAVTGAVERQVLETVRLAPGQRVDVKATAEQIARTLPRTAAKRDNRVGTVCRAIKNLTDKGLLRVAPRSDGAEVELPVRALPADTPDPFTI